MSASAPRLQQPSQSANQQQRVEAAGLTDVGRERNTNEDAFLIATLQRAIIVHDASPAARGWMKGEPAGTLLVVADGMGGMGGGDVASRTAVDAVAEYLLNVMPWTKATRQEVPSRSSVTGLRDQLSSALAAGDQSVKAAGAHSGTPRMGTTLTAALVVFPFVFVAHVGDTRCYLRQGGRLRQLTKDHNLAQKLVDESPSAVEPPAHLQHILWNSLGASDELPVPDLCKVELAPGDCLLLCSDGLNKHVTDEQIEELLGNEQSCAAQAAQLVQLALEGGGTDNVTAIVAKVLGPSP